ncbi:helix-turn-helix domain-containing protein [Virgibacillus halophilus]|uniref:helix-turn-helix domain-containing protein n=1 Tax=Tigheibacillus halophilus TaxID=361280 RepID=UPI00362E2D7A
MTNPLKSVIGVSEASKLWGLSPGYIKNLCSKGKISAKKIGKTWVIDASQSKPFLINRTNNQIRRKN